jgi:hypothetical protein
MSNSSYACISRFGNSIAKTDETINPLTYCLLATVDAPFSHGEIANTLSGKYSKNGQAFMSDYCSNNWNEVCEFASQDRNRNYPNTLSTCGGASDVECRDLNAGEILVANTAARKYLVQMGGSCSLRQEPFDPTVASSPMVSFWSSGPCNMQGNEGCIPVYAVDPATIDSDVVMNKLLAKPTIAWDILVNIYNTAKRTGKYDGLMGTKIYNFFQSPSFQNFIVQQKTMTKAYNNSSKCCK